MKPHLTSCIYSGKEVANHPVTGKDELRFGVVAHHVLDDESTWECHEALPEFENDKEVNL